MWWLLHDHMHMSYSCKWKKFGRQYLILANSLILTSFWISWFLETFIVSSKYAFFLYPKYTKLYKWIFSAIRDSLPGEDLLEKLSLEKVYCLFKNNFFEVVSLFILFIMPVVLLYLTMCTEICALSHCSLNPGEARCELRGWKETKASIGTADVFILSWLTEQP